MNLIIVILSILAFLFARIRTIRVTLHSKGSSNQSIDQSLQHLVRSFNVTFLVPAWNAGDSLHTFVESYKGLDMPNKQLVLCAGGADGTYEAATSYASRGITVLEQPPGMGKQRALRISYPEARGDYIYLTDIDCVLDMETVSRTLAAITVSKLGAATGPIQPLSFQLDSPFVRSQWAVERYLALRSPRYCEGIRGNNAVVTRQAVDDSGAFGQNVFSGTDYTMAKELLARGHRIVYCPESQMRSEFPGTIKVYVRKQARWIRNVLVLGRKYNAPREIIGTILTVSQPVVYLVLVLIGLIAPGAWVTVALLILNALLNRMAYGRVSDISVSPVGALLHLCGDLGATLLVMYQLVSRKFTW